jgi:hypothetical protein
MKREKLKHTPTAGARIFIWRRLVQYTGRSDTNDMCINGVQGESKIFGLSTFANETMISHVLLQNSA